MCLALMYFVLSLCCMTHTNSVLIADFPHASFTTYFPHFLESLIPSTSTVHILPEPNSLSSSFLSYFSFLPPSIIRYFPRLSLTFHFFLPTFLPWAFSFTLHPLLMSSILSSCFSFHALPWPMLISDILHYPPSLTYSCPLQSHPLIFLISLKPHFTSLAIRSTPFLPYKFPLSLHHSSFLLICSHSHNLISFPFEVFTLLISVLLLSPSLTTSFSLSLSLC